MSSSSPQSSRLWSSLRHGGSSHSSPSGTTRGAPRTRLSKSRYRTRASTPPARRPVRASNAALPRASRAHHSRASVIVPSLAEPPRAESQFLVVSLLLSRVITRAAPPAPARLTQAPAAAVIRQREETRNTQIRWAQNRVTMRSGGAPMGGEKSDRGGVKRRRRHFDHPPKGVLVLLTLVTEPHNRSVL